MMEIWKDIKDFEGLYAVSILGRVKSLNYNRTGKERVLKPAKRDKRGYLFVTLCKDGVTKHFLVHRLVAEAFLPNPENKPCIDHIVPVSLGGGNEVFNLRWVTYQENNNNPITKQKYSDAKNDVRKQVIGVNKETGVEVCFSSVMEAEKLLDIAHQNIFLCCRGKRKSAGGYIWRYA